MSFFCFIARLFTVIWRFLLAIYITGMPFWGVFVRFYVICLSNNGPSFFSRKKEFGLFSENFCSNFFRHGWFGKKTFLGLCLCLYHSRSILLYEQKMFFCLHQTFIETQRDLRSPFLSPMMPFLWQINMHIMVYFICGICFAASRGRCAYSGLTRRGVSCFSFFIFWVSC